jgi:hypothetical protein
MMSRGAKLKWLKTSLDWQRVGSIHDLPMIVPAIARMILQFKGLGGGVPLNTEMSTAKCLWLRKDPP